MRKLYPILFSFSLHLHADAQLVNGGIYASFGVDGDTRAGYAKYGPVQGTVSSDDWFSPLLSGFNVIDTSNASFYRSLLQAGNNIAFSKRMSQPLYSKSSNKLWLDAVYGRDYTAANSSKDSTAFTIACKNGDNPTNWVGGITSFPNKNDLIDVYAHMRRDGVNVHDSLWLFSAVSMLGTSGSRYFDIELYKNTFSYLGSTGKFMSAGPDSGHTQWLFDSGGNIIQTGDIILAVTFNPGAPPLVDFRLWVSQSTFTGAHPAFFNFGSSFDGATAAFGYASIVSKSGTTTFGGGISNYSPSSSNDTTYSTPWGTMGSLSGSNQWIDAYQSQQLVEIGLNLTRIGIDPALYTFFGLNPCQSLFKTIFFKSRSSNSFTSNMQDFVAPLDFLSFPVMDYSITPDVLTCVHKSATLTINNQTTAGNYTWSTLNGNITSSYAYGNTISVNKTGTYIVSAAPAAGCSVTRTDTIVVPIDTLPPEATIRYGLTFDQTHIQLLGGDVAASNFATPFGGSQGLLWDWSGPGGFLSSIQNPLSEKIEGTYQLIVTEKRNGCTDTATQYITYVILATSPIQLKGIVTNNVVQLEWTADPDTKISSFEVERSSRPESFYSIYSVPGSINNGNLSAYAFSDVQPKVKNYYRIKGISGKGQVVYSKIIFLVNSFDGEGDYLSVFSATASNGLVINSGSTRPVKVGVTIFNTQGALLYNKNMVVHNGQNRISLNLNCSRNLELIASVYTEGGKKYVKKIIY
ncbi:MAG: hypothetical protein NVS1B13_22550 [Flavisolibacter sp.]